MLAGIYNFSVDQGATFSRRITLRNPDETLYDLTGYTARMHIRRELPDTETMLILTTENGRITLGGNLGTIDLLVDDEDTATLTRDGVYDLEIEDDEGAVYRVLKGAVRVSLEVTR